MVNHGESAVNCCFKNNTVPFKHSHHHKSKCTCVYLYIWTAEHSPIRREKGYFHKSSCTSFCNGENTTGSGHHNNILFFICGFCPVKCFSEYSPLKFCSMCKIPCMPSLTIVPQLEKKKKKRTNIWLNFCYICCLSALFYFSLCDCSQVAISPPAISPPVSMVKPIVDSIHVYEHIFEDALSLSCDFPPLLMAFNFSWQPRQMEGPFIMLFFLFHRASSEPCVCVWLSMWAAF